MEIYQNSAFFARIEKIISYSRLPAYKFAAMVGVSQTFLSEMKAGRSGPSFKMLVGILSVYQDLNPRWLLFGEGEMFEPSGAVHEQSAPYGRLNALINELKALPEHRQTAVMDILEAVLRAEKQE